MKGNYPDDTFTENDVLSCLESAGLKFRRGQRYILSQCPLHDDENPSCQIYRDDWFVQCHASCGRFHISKAFPELRGHAQSTRAYNPKPRAMTEHQYKAYDQMAEWEAMPLIPRDHVFKHIPLEVLDQLGWRWNDHLNSYYIPYFSASKGSIPFSQFRHLSGDRRFTFLKDAKPTCYGTWNLDNPKIFVVEGASDAAVMEYAAVPWIALPSAASGELIKALAHYCDKKGIELVYAGDVDAAGDKLLEALDETNIGFRVKQPRTPYKDWGDMFEAEGIESVQDYCFPELGTAAISDTHVDRVLKVWPDARVQNLTAPQEIVRSNQSQEAAEVLY